jgi:sigma-B regulation protein RsbU (phosphoserine phosphatase)
VIAPALLAVAIGAATFVAGGTIESWIVAFVGANAGELEWISDVVLSTTVAVIAYLWLHLRTARLKVSALEREQIVVGEQLRLAAEIQRGLLPTIPNETRGYRWYARMVPAGTIGGDFYDFLQLSNGTALAIVGDVSGKGIPAALIHSSLRILFRQMARDTMDPAAILQRVSVALYEETGGHPYATAIVVRAQSDPPRLAYANAGHPSGLVLRGGECLALAADGPPLGLFPEVVYASTERPLSPHDLVVLVTDGITEALEGIPLTVAEALSANAARWRSTAQVGEGLLDLSARGPGPAGVADWQDDRTAFVFQVDGKPLPTAR